MGKFCVEVQAKWFINFPNEAIKNRDRKEPKPLRTQYQVTFDTRKRRNQKVFNSECNELKDNFYSKRKSHKK